MLSLWGLTRCASVRASPAAACRCRRRLRTFSCGSQGAQVTDFALLYDVARKQPGVVVSALEEYRRTIVGANAAFIGAASLPSPAPGRPHAPTAVLRMPAIVQGSTPPIWPAEMKGE